METSSFLPAAPPLMAAGREHDAGRVDLSRPPDCPTTCRMNAHQSTNPPVILAGETSKISLTIKGVCPKFQMTSRIVFVVDPDEAISRDELREIQTTIRGLVEHLESSSDAPAMLGLVSVGEKASVLSALTTNSDQMLAASSRLKTDDHQALHLGIQEAKQMITKSRIGDCDRSARYSDLIISFSSGISSRDCRPVARAASKADSDGNPTSRGLRRLAMLRHALPSKLCCELFSLFLRVEGGRPDPLRPAPNPR